MISFDVSKEWVIRIPTGIPAVKQAAEDLSHYIGLLQTRSKSERKPPFLKDMSEKSPDSPGAVIRLLVRQETREKNGFSWRLGKEGIEITGESDRGLCNGVFAFLAALGFAWPEPDKELLPALGNAKTQEYTLRENYAYQPSSPDTIRRRLLFGREGPTKKWKSLILWAARNQIDTLVFSIRSAIPDKDTPNGNFFSKSFQKAFKKLSGSPQELLALAESYAMTIELGGWDLSIFVPRRYYLFNREIFRMDAGKRDKEHNFCPTAPDTIRLLKSESAKVFRSHPEILIYHLWPDFGHEKAWCSCPTCRAFTVEEQNRIAVNAVADTLAQINPHGRISYYENPPRKGDIEARPNLFRVNCLPGETGAEAGGWFISGSTAPS
ncbi:MAG: DUF4838 domain-containing protein [Spirochaetaceae bacterium]|jgi:hypothetical protein|nr:DUF4838 domain-containing protein [Spirochaetaceae bacterium]